MASPIPEPPDRSPATTPSPRRRRVAIIALAVAAVLLVNAVGGLYAYMKVTEAGWQVEHAERQDELDALTEQVNEAANAVEQDEQSRRMFESFADMLPPVPPEDQVCLDAVRAYLADAADGAAELTFAEVCAP